MQTTYVVQRSITLTFIPAHPVLQKGDTLKFDTSNNNKLTAYRNNEIVVNTEHTPMGMAAMVKSGVLVETSSAVKAAAEAAQLAAAAAETARFHVVEAARIAAELATNTEAQQASADAAEAAAVAAEPKAEPIETGPSLHKMSKKQLIAHAKDKYPDLVLDPRATVPEVLAQIQAYASSPTATTTEADDVDLDAEDYDGEDDGEISF